LVSVPNKKRSNLQAAAINLLPEEAYDESLARSPVWKYIYNDAGANMAIGAIALLERMDNVV
jgi:hypothetical protein